MASDPWTWTAAEVQHFFVHTATAYAADRPNAQLPPLDQFVQALVDNDVDGASLFELDLALLKNEFGINSTSVRSTVLHCIRKLKAESRALQSSQPSAQQPPVPQPAPTTPPLPFVHQIPGLIAASEVPAAALPEIGSNVREGEHQIEDRRGKKRRKLNLSAVQVVMPKASHDKTSYLPDRSQPVDELFFGKTRLGHSTDDHTLGPSDLIFDPNYSDAEDNFEVVCRDSHAGASRFVYSRMKHFLQAPEVQSIQRQGEGAIAVLPYPQGWSKASRSALVVQKGEDEEYTAVREEAALLQSGHDDTGLDRGDSTSLGEWEFLLKNHAHKDGEEEVMGGLGTDEASDIMATATQTNYDDEEGAEEDDDENDKAFTNEEASIIIDRVLVEHVSEWQTARVPKLEDKEAWSLWKKMKGSRTLRDDYIRAAEGTIQLLTNRLDKLKARLLESDFPNERSIEGACGSLEPTVEEMAMQRWKISVWQRKKEPPHTVQHRLKQKSHGALQTPATAVAAQGFVVRPEDRMSVSPTPAEHVNVGSLAEAAESPIDQPSEAFHTPGSTPSNEDDGFLASDDMSIDPIDSDNTTATRGAAGEAALQGAEVAESPEDLVTEHDEAMEYSGLAQDSPSLRRIKDESLSNPHALWSPVKGEGLQQIMDAVRSSDNELPSPSTYIRPRKQQTPTKKGVRPEPIEISDSSGSKPRVRRPKLKKSAGRGRYGRAEHATEAEIAEWDLRTLVRDGVRAHVLVKLLYEAGAATRDTVHHYFQLFHHPGLEAQIRAALRTLASKDAEAEGLQIETADAFKQCANFARIWLRLDEDTCEITDLEGFQYDWVALTKSEDQFKMFTDQFVFLLQKVRAKMASPSNSQKSKPMQPSDSILITDDDEDDEVHPDNQAPRSSRKNRKRKVEQSQSAADHRRVAKERVDKFKKAVGESQSTDPAALELMVAGGASPDNIEINPGRDREAFDAVYIDPQIAVKMKPHQIEGVQFLWREITTQEVEGGQGALLAHTMGLGKTMQSIVLLMAVAETAQAKEPRLRRQLPKHLHPRGLRKVRKMRILILCPPSLLVNWAREIQLWARQSLGNVFTLGSTKEGYLDELRDWHKLGGVLLVGYTIFRNLCSREAPKPPKTTKPGKAAKPEKTPKHAADWNELDELLLRGPEIVVADEVHNIKNTKAGVSQAVGRIETGSRIGLTGTPMSNDVQEMYALISWVAEGYLGELNEFNAYYAEPIKEGTYADSSRWEIRKSIKRLAVLRHETEAKIHRADITALKGFLPPKVEYMLFVPLTALQLAVYNKYLAALIGGDRDEKVSSVQIFSWLAVLTLLTNHPLAFKRRLLTPLRKTLKEVELSPETGANTPANEAAGPATPEADPTAPSLYSMGFTEAMVQDITAGLTDDIDPSLSAKMSIFMEIVQKSIACGDKMLVFTGSIPTLEYINELLKSQRISFGRIDGKVPIKNRTKILEDFINDYDILLISTRAGGTGLNMQAANRVVIFDFGFNPAHEEQAIGRAYRLGQTKPVYVYRFVAGGTFEANIYNKQIFKLSLAQRVVDQKNPRRNADRNPRDYLHAPESMPQEDLSQERGKDAHVLDRILDSYTRTGKPQIRGIKTMETLQQDAKDDQLNEAEQKEVAEEIEQIKQRPRGRRTTALASTQAGVIDYGALPRGALTQSLQLARPEAPSATAPV